jgi:hypothetical protein
MNSQTLTKSILLLMVAVAISCADEPQAKQEVTLAQVRNGMLEFADQEAFDQLAAKSHEELSKWESSLPGFVSIGSLYKKAVIEEETFFNNGGKEGEHSPFVSQHMSAFTFVSEEYMRPNLPPHTERQLPYVVNENGLVKIGATIFEYRSGSIKQITDGDESKISQLTKYQISDESANIIVTTFTKINSDNVFIEGRTAFSGNSSCTGYTSGGGQRVKGQVDLFASETSLGGITYLGAYVNVHATNQERRLGIWSGKRTSELYISGSIYVAPEWEWGGVVVELGTGGDLETSIGTTYSFPDRPKVSATWPYMYGALTFYGRQGSSCAI